MMVRQNPGPPGSACHPDVWELLPWHANGTLESHEREAIDERLAACASCRAELARCHELAAAVLTAPAPGWSPSPAHFSRILARVDAASAPGARRTAWWGRWSANLRRALAPLQTGSPVLRGALVAQGVLVLGLAAIVAWQVSSSSARYQTLARSGDGPLQGSAHVRVAFADDITERELRTVLSGVGGTIVAGPSPLGLYTVEIRPREGGGPDGLAQALARLRAHAKIRLAEPATPR